MISGQVIEAAEAKEGLIEVDSDIFLCPFLDCFVEKYHGWMQDEELCEATGSLKMSLQEVKEAQQYARNPKSNFDTSIILFHPKTTPESPKSLKELYEENPSQVVDFAVGDINFTIDKAKKTVEINIMIAEQKCRRKGVSFRILENLKKTVNQLYPGTETLIAIINHGNNASISLFEKKLGFELVENMEVFKQFKYSFRLKKQPEE